MRRFAAPSRRRFASRTRASRTSASRLEVGELEHHKPGGLPVAFEDGELAAPDDERPPPACTAPGDAARSARTAPGRGCRSRRSRRQACWIVRLEQRSTFRGGDGGARGPARATAAAGDVVTVAGELGSGKTTFVRGACRALGVREPVTSPTFTIGHRYRATASRSSHLDLYRFAGSRGGVGRPRAVLRGHDRLRRVAGGGQGGSRRRRASP